MSERPPTAKPATQEDRVFAEPHSISTDFRFDEKVAAVFDDMVSRSVPYYNEMQRMTSELAADFAVEGTNLYDLGCATGTTLLALDAVLPPPQPPGAQAAVNLIGIDASEEMLAKAREKAATRRTNRKIDFRCADLHEGSLVQNASVVTMILTLQFIRPLQRAQVVADIARGMNSQGCLILIEKLTMPDSLFNRLFIKHYHDLKLRRGYSELEIAQKREALENVLIPYRLEENRELLLSNGFNHFEVFFRWYNFCGMIAVK